MNTVTVDELRRAWGAVSNGQFQDAAAPGVVDRAWNPNGQVIAVIGVGGRVGATTISLAIAESAPTTARVVEVGTPHSWGLAAAANAELGDAGSWRHGMREAVRIERPITAALAADQASPPAATSCDVTVLDLGWDLSQIKGAGGWMAAAFACAELVLVAAPTVPGMRSLELTLAELNVTQHAWCALIGSPKKKWPRRVQLAAPTGLEAIASNGRLICVPPDRSLAIEGITTSPLPTAVLSACHIITSEVAQHPKGIHHVATN